VRTFSIVHPCTILKYSPKGEGVNPIPPRDINNTDTPNCAMAKAYANQAEEAGQSADSASAFILTGFAQSQANTWVQEACPEQSTAPQPGDCPSASDYPRYQNS